VPSLVGEVEYTGLKPYDIDCETSLWMAEKEVVLLIEYGPPLTTDDNPLAPAEPAPIDWSCLSEVRTEITVYGATLGFIAKILDEDNISNSLFAIYSPRSPIYIII
jgi:hypothetical protein